VRLLLNLPDFRPETELTSFESPSINDGQKATELTVVDEAQVTEVVEQESTEE
jgi:hypothetical protein